jgi:hypothetical protein
MSRDYGALRLWSTVLMFIGILGVSIFHYNRRNRSGGERRERGKAVHARVSILEGPPDKIDEGLLYFREEVEPAWETDPGFKGAIALNDRQSGKTLAITFWEREEDMRDMEKEANRVRSKVAETTGQEIAGVEQYEVGLFEVEG